MTVPEVEASRPETLIRSARGLDRCAAGLASRIDRQRSTLDQLRARWHGVASDAAIEASGPTLVRLQRIHDALTRTREALLEDGATLAQTRMALCVTVRRLSEQGWQVAPDGTVSTHPGGPLSWYAGVGAVNALRLQQLAATNSAILVTLLADFDTADRRLSHELRAAVEHVATGPSVLGAPMRQGPSWDDGSQIPMGRDPTAVAAWWASLGQPQRDALVRDWPDRLGNLDGIPVADRDQANRAVLQRDVDRLADVAAARGVSVGEVTAHPRLYGMASGMMDRYVNAIEVRKGLRHNQERTGAPTFLQVYEPDAFGGAGRAVVAVGNPDFADDTVVVVPGTGNSVTEGWLSQSDVTNVFGETVAADRDRSTAVVAWMGYDAPNGLLDPRVGQVGLAREGGRLLAADVNALDVTRVGDSHVTVMGHSYGSTTVSDAAAGFGMRADDVILIGCPGTDMAQNAEDFNLPPGGHVYVGSASTDPVTQFGGIPQIHVPGTEVTVALGADPAQEGFGSTRFKAEVPGITDPLHDHGQYLAPGSESLFSVGDIASGHGDALAHDGMMAPHRGSGLAGILDDLGVPMPDDPEIYRAPTSGHRHRLVS